MIIRLGSLKREVKKMNLDIDYFKTKLKEITEWYENTRWNKKALLEKISELDMEINKTRDAENLIDWDNLSHIEAVSYTHLTLPTSDLE